MPEICLKTSLKHKILSLDTEELKFRAYDFMASMTDLWMKEHPLVVAVHGTKKPTDREPIFYISDKDFATTGETWKYQR